MGLGLLTNNLRMKSLLDETERNVGSPSLPLWDVKDVAADPIAHLLEGGYWSLIPSLRINQIGGGALVTPRTPIYRVAPKFERVGSMTGEYPHLKHKTVPWNYATRRTPLATAATIGSSARYDTASIDIFMPEKAERVIESAELIFTFRTEFPTNQTTTGVLMGIQIGSGPTDDEFRVQATTTQTASRNQFWRISRDVTDYCQRWMVLGGNIATSTFASVASIAVQTSGVAAVNCITVKLQITYAHAGSDARVQCIRFPIQSHTTTLSTAQEEIGTDGTSPAPSGQIPDFDAVLPELGKFYHQITLCITANDNATVGVNITPAVSFDGGADIPLATIDATLVPAVQLYDQMDLIAAGLSTSASHTFSMKGDAVTSGKLMWPSGWIEVVYEYDHPATLANNLAMYEQIIPIVASDGVTMGPVTYDSIIFGSNEIQQALSLVAAFDIDEPGVATLHQSGVMWISNIGSATSSTYRSTENQELRQLVASAANLGPIQTVHRVDTTGGWPTTLPKGRNRFKVYTLNSGRTWSQLSYAIINYTAEIKDDVENGAHPVAYLQHTLASSYTIAGAGVGAGPLVVAENDAIAKRVQLGRPYKIIGAVTESWSQMGANTGYVLALNNRANERDGLWTYLQTNYQGDVKHQGMPSNFAFTPVLNQTSNASGNLDIEAPRMQVMNSIFQINPSWSYWITYHQHQYELSGTLMIDGGAVSSDSRDLEVWCYDPTNFLKPVERIGTVNTGEGNGGDFTFYCFDNTKQYFVTYTDAMSGYYGRSKYGMADGVFDKDVTINTQPPFAPVIGSNLTRSAV